MDGELPKLRIFDWNILTESYASYDRYNPDHYEPEAFGPDRQAKIREIIHEHITKRDVIVLHEVDAEMRRRLFLLAEECNYVVRDPSHGNKYNGHMGSSIMWPRDRYEIEDVQMIHVGDWIAENISDRDASRSSSSASRSSIGRWIWDALTQTWQWIRCKSRIGMHPDPRVPYQKATSRWNVMTVVVLEDRDTRKSYTIAAYHMPCAFREPEVMRLHTDAVTQILKHPQFVDTDIFLCTDGNYQPTDPCYELMETQGFESLHNRVFGYEPEWTCRTWGEFAGEFAGTLDYIWYRGNQNKTTRNASFNMKIILDSALTGQKINIGPKPVSTTDLDSKSKSKQPYLPNKHFPSDHKWLEIEFYYPVELKNSRGALRSENLSMYLSHHSSGSNGSIPN